MFSKLRAVFFFVFVAQLCACASLLPKFDTNANPMPVAGAVVASVSPDVIVVDSIPPMPIPVPEEFPIPLIEVEEPPMFAKAKVEIKDSELTCMATAMYREARGEGTLGMAAVGHLILNRIDHSYFADSICGVVYERSRKGRCEFNWVCNGLGAPSPERLEAARQVALRVVNGEIPNPIGDSLFFRTVTSHGQMRYERYVATIGNHRFFARRGRA